MKQALLLSAVTMAIGAAGGYLVGHQGEVAGGKEVAEETPRVRSSVRAGGDSGSKGLAAKSKMTYEKARMAAGSGGKVQGMLDYYSGLRVDQFEGEAAKLSLLPFGERMMASMLLFGKWAEHDPQAALAYANTMGFSGVMVKPSILQTWAGTDPAAAAKYYADNIKEFGMMGGGRGPMGGANGAATIAGEWAIQDPAAALKWAQGLSGDKEDAVKSVLSQVAKQDPKKAIEMMKGMPVAEQGEVSRSIALQYGSKNFNEAAAWIKGLPAEVQADAMAQAIKGLSSVNPSEAASQVALMEAGESKDTALRNVVESMVRDDPKGAAELLVKQGSTEGFESGLRDLMPTWTTKDPQAALAFANSLQDQGSKDAALQQWVQSNTTTQSSEVVKVAEGISDEGDRVMSIAIATAKWMKEDQEAAKAYIQQSTSIPDKMKESLISGQSMFGGRGGRGGRGGWR